LTRGGTLPNLRVTLIDGFAGGGEYVVQGAGAKIHEGSPIILINAVRAAIARIDVERTKPISVDANFIFIEKQREAFNYLEATLEGRFEKAFLEEKVRRIHGAFEDHVWEIVGRLRSSRTKKPRAIFVLDQYGYNKIPIDMIARIMRELENAEIFLTLAVDHISAFAGSLKEARERLRSSLHIDLKGADFVEGSRDIEELDQLPEHERSAIMQNVQLLLHEAFATQAGARCYTPFFITSTGSHRSYWFLHLANNARANDVVKELHWQQTNHFMHYGRAGTNMFMLGFDPSRPSRAQLSFAFDDSARTRTLNALIEELPEILQKKFQNGVTLKDLYADICNVTPASKLILGDGLNELCSLGELEKVGVQGEERLSTTKVKDDDIVRPTGQRRLFSFSDLRKRR
jgi:three-Cys-motif partner protein